MSNPIKVRMVRRFGWQTYPWLNVTCDDHPDFNWTFYPPSREPADWESALMIAYGHAAWAHGCRTCRNHYSPDAPHEHRHCVMCHD